MIPLGAATPAVLWHYTVSSRLEGIIADGLLKRGTTGLRAGERAGVWFTLRQDWEPTATRWRRDVDGRVHAATMAEMVSLGLARIGVAPEVARTTWSQHRRFGGLLFADAEAIERNARQQGSEPDDWRASYKDVPQALWLRVEMSADGLTWTTHARV
jgi:hypothetical protein